MPRRRSPCAQTDTHALSLALNRLPFTERLERGHLSQHIQSTCPYLEVADELIMGGI